MMPAATQFILYLRLSKISYIGFILGSSNASKLFGYINLCIYYLSAIEEPRMNPIKFTYFNTKKAASHEAAFRMNIESLDNNHYEKTYWDCAVS